MDIVFTQIFLVLSLVHITISRNPSENGIEGDIANVDHPIHSGKSHVGEEKETHAVKEDIVGKEHIDSKEDINGKEHIDGKEDIIGIDAEEYDDEAKVENQVHKYYAENIALTQLDPKISWPLGIIHYYIDILSYDHVLEQRLISAMNVIQSVSCVQFHQHAAKPVDYKGFWIHITNPKKERKCVHAPEFLPDGEIMLVLGLDCLKQREILHALMHGIGIPDEITHPLRDHYVRVMWENIQPEYRDLFILNNDARDPKSLVEYDPLSIMHFHDRAFSLNGKASIAPVVPGLQISPSDRLSQIDKMKLRILFGHECNRRVVDELLDTCKNALIGQQTKSSQESREVNEKLRFRDMLYAYNSFPYHRENRNN